MKKNKRFVFISHLFLESQRSFLHGKLIENNPLTSQIRVVTIFLLLKGYGGGFPNKCIIAIEPQALISHLKACHESSFIVLLAVIRPCGMKLVTEIQPRSPLSQRKISICRCKLYCYHTDQSCKQSNLDEETDTYKKDDTLTEYDRKYFHVSFCLAMLQHRNLFLSFLSGKCEMS